MLGVLPDDAVLECPLSVPRAGPAPELLPDHLLDVLLHLAHDADAALLVPIQHGDDVGAAPVFPVRVLPGSLLLLLDVLDYALFPLQDVLFLFSVVPVLGRPSALLLLAPGPGFLGLSGHPVPDLCQQSHTLFPKRAYLIYAPVEALLREFESISGRGGHVAVGLRHRDHQLGVDLQYLLQVSGHAVETALVGGQDLLQSRQ